MRKLAFWLLCAAVVLVPAATWITAVCGAAFLLGGRCPLWPSH